MVSRQADTTRNPLFYISWQTAPDVLPRSSAIGGCSLRRRFLPITISEFGSDEVDRHTCPGEAKTGHRLIQGPYFQPWCRSCMASNCRALIPA